MLTVILKRTRIIFKSRKGMERPGNEATQTSHLHAHLHKTQRKLDVKRSNLGASQVNYITYSIVLFLLFSQFVLTIIFVVSLSSREKTTGKWGHFTLVNIYICVCTCVTMCLCASVYPYLCLLQITFPAMYVHTTTFSTVLLSLAQQSMHRSSLVAVVFLIQ